MSPGRLALHLFLAAALFPVSGRAGEPAAKQPKTKPAARAWKPHDLSLLGAADLAAIGNPFAAIAILDVSRSMELWGDWPAPARAHATAAEPIDPDLLKGVRDLTPYPDPRPASAESRAGDEAVVIAAHTEPEDLAEAGRRNRDITADRLYLDPKKYRGQVVHVRGRLRSLRRVQPSPWARERGVKDLYEGWVFTDPLQTRAVLAVVNRLPAGMKAGEDVNEAVDLNGYFLKVGIYRAPGVLRVMPVVTGRELARHRGPLPGPDPDHAPSVAPLLVGVRDETGIPPPPAERGKVSPRALVEFWGFCETVLTASRTSAAALTNSAKPNAYVTWAHLHLDPAGYRGKVIPLVGRLKRLFPADVPDDLRRLGVKHLYEGWVFGTTFGSNPWCVLCTDLPAGMHTGADVDYSVKFAGYFFKKYRYPAQDVDRYTALLIGRTVQILQEAPPPVRPAAPPGLKTRYRDEAPAVGKYLEDVEDKTRLGTPRDKGTGGGEFWGYCETVLKAAQTAPEAFARSARDNRGVTYHQVQKDPAAYRGKVIPVAGKLVRVRLRQAPAYLQARGIAWLYEGWIVAPTNPQVVWWVVFTELPPDIPVAESLTLPAAFDGYFFKKIRYTDPREDRYAPFLIGRTVRLTKPAPAAAWHGFSGPFVVGLTGLVAGIIVLAVGLGWWFRRGDRRVQARLSAARSVPPFEAEAGPGPGPGSPPPGGPALPEGQDVRRNGH